LGKGASFTTGRRFCRLLGRTMALVFAYAAVSALPPGSAPMDSA